MHLSCKLCCALCFYPMLQEFRGAVADPLYTHASTYLNGKGNKDVHRLLASLPRGTSTQVQFTLAREAQTSDSYRFEPCWMWSLSCLLQLWGHMPGRQGQRLC